MGKLMSFGRVLECFNFSSGSCTSCMSFNSSMEDLQDYDECDTKSLITSEDKSGQLLRSKDVVAENHTLASQLKPKIVMLRVSMHCNGCARKVEKQISKIDGVTSYRVDLENKQVVVIGDILPFEVLRSVSKVKNAQLWESKEPETSEVPANIP